ncbi:hypothetical protein M0R45_032903 [Rubus argutus]|uniref:Autophagy-related protein n=1 Tax=Rubus argutus TaxID=59490 RepID=A0AAW1WLM6_RUBAR
MAKKSYKMENPFEKREAEAARIRMQYPDRRPVIVERAKKSDVPEIAKNKYLNILPPNAALMSAVYEEHKDEDGFLYITYSGESTFGTF